MTFALFIAQFSNPIIEIQTTSYFNLEKYFRGTNICIVCVLRGEGRERERENTQANVGTLGIKFKLKKKTPGKIQLNCAPICLFTHMRIQKYLKCTHARISVKYISIMIIIGARLLSVTVFLVECLLFFHNFLNVLAMTERDRKKPTNQSAKSVSMSTNVVWNFTFDSKICQRIFLQPIFYLKTIMPK